MDYLKRKQADERLVSVVSLNDEAVTRDIVCRVGPVDAVLVALARNEKCPLLTDDQRLLSCCESAGQFEIQLMKNLL